MAATTPYFAYGSNMDPDQMAQRCTGALAQGVARLDGWRFRIDGRGVATIDPAPGAVVHGVVWHLRDDHVAELDYYEGVASGYYRRDWLDVDTATARLRTLVYIGADLSEGEPRVGYLERILDGARHFGLADQYVAELADWSRADADRGTLG